MLVRKEEPERKDKSSDSKDGARGRSMCKRKREWSGHAEAESD